MMASQETIFIALTSVFFGVSLFAWLLLRKVKRKKTLSHFSISGVSKNIEESLFEKIDQLLPNAVSTNTEEIERKFYSAGFYDFKLAHLYMPAKYLAATIGAGFIYWFISDATSSLTIIAYMCVWLVICISVPDTILSVRANALQEKLSSQLPYLLDLLAMCVQTGMTIESSMSYLAQEMRGFDKDIAHLLNRTNDRARIVGLDQALDELYTKVPTNEMRSFVMTLKQSLHYGSSIYGVLSRLAADIRNVRMLSLEEKIGKLAAKMSIPLIVFIMVPIVILIAAPGVMRMMSGAY